MRFVHDTLPQRARFGSGEAAASLRAEIAALGASKVMLIASKSGMHLADEITTDLPVALRHDDVVMHVPVEVAGRGRDAARANGIDVLVSVGGGSTTGLAKAIALTSGLPIIAVPTTYAGSEATPVWGLTEGATKTTPHALRDYGLAEDSIAEAADAILPAVPASNPREVTAGDLRALLRAAWSGTDPGRAFTEA